jgi:hypothetical protein
MPVSPKYTWSQSDTHVCIDVALSGITRQKPEVFGTSALVKVVADPYFLLVDLAHDVKFDKGVAIVKPGKIHFSLPKVGVHPVLLSLRGKPCAKRQVHSKLDMHSQHAIPAVTNNTVRANICSSIHSLSSVPGHHSPSMKDTFALNCQMTQSCLRHGDSSSCAFRLTVNNGNHC